MGLGLDSLFIKVLSLNKGLMSSVGLRLYDTAIPLPDEDAMNAPIPYIIVSFDALDNDQSTKDDPYEGDSDTVAIGVTVAARTREELAVLTRNIRKTIHDSFLYVQRYVPALDSEGRELFDADSLQLFVLKNHDEIIKTVPYDYRLTAGPVIYDSDKPCFFQTLKYSCDVVCDITRE